VILIAGVESLRHTLGTSTQNGDESVIHGITRAQPRHRRTDEQTLTGHSYLDYKFIIKTTRKSKILEGFFFLQHRQLHYH